MRQLVEQGPDLRRDLPRDARAVRAPAVPRDDDGAYLLDDEARYRYWLGDFAQETPVALQQLRHALDT